MIENRTTVGEATLRRATWKCGVLLGSEICEVCSELLESRRTIEELQRRLDAATHVDELERENRASLERRLNAALDFQRQAVAERDEAKELLQLADQQRDARERAWAEASERSRVLANDLGAKQVECVELRRLLAASKNTDATVRTLQLVAQNGEIFASAIRADGSVSATIKL